MQRVPARTKAKPPPARFVWAPKHGRRLAGPRIGEVLPRRDHVLRLTYLAAGGWLLLLLLFVIFDATWLPRSLGAVAAGAFVGWLAGLVQARWLWRGEVPAPIWAGYSALGWAAGAALVSALYALQRASDPEGSGYTEAYFALLMIVGGPVAGLVAGARQARVLRGRGLDGGWWIAASTAATAIGWSIWFILALMM
jgi:hypothetical protein